MGAQLRAVRRRIRSVRSTAKITRAQELIAASRIIKAQQRVQAAGPYAREIARAVEAVVSRSHAISHPLTTEPPSRRRAAILLITSDRGFCGGYNANVLREAQALAQLLRDQSITPAMYVVGAKGLVWHRFRGREMAAQWHGFSDNPRHEHARQITSTLLQAFEALGAEGGVHEIHLVYTEFVSMLSQNPVARRILPLVIEESTEMPPGGPVPVYEFEPSAETVLNALLPAYVQSLLYYALLQAAASEHASRRRAMKSATDNANELIEQLTRAANQARQAEITQEISEIVGGANALAEATAGSE
jgi:F-type H+-transporting ATPase subunit gamma